MASVRRIGASMLGLVRTRAELFVVELQEEKLRAITLLLWLGFGAALGLAAVLIIIGTLALYFWQHAGYVGLVGLAGGTLTVAVAVFWGIRRRILRGPQPFAGTLEEFRKDAECLRRPE